VLIKTPKRECEEIIIGGDLNALLQSYKNNTPLIINKLSPPHYFETLETYNAQELWHRLFFILSTSGLNLVGQKAQNVRIKENEISVSTTGARVFKYKTEKLLIFDDENVHGLPPPEKKNEDFIVLDWMFSRSCEKHPHKHLTTGDALASEVYFYASNRTDGHHPDRKDLVVISHLNEGQLHDFEYSDTYAKFKVTKMLKDLGIKGKKNGINHYALKLEVEKREIKKAKMSLYTNSEQMEFKYSPPPQINDLCQGIV
jgi:hypothetical protein